MRSTLAMVFQVRLNHSSCQVNTIPPALPAARISRYMETRASPCWVSLRFPWFRPRLSSRAAMPREEGTPNSEMTTGMAWCSLMSRRYCR